MMRDAKLEDQGDRVSSSSRTCERVVPFPWIVGCLVESS